MFLFKVVFTVALGEGEERTFKEVEVVLTLPAPTGFTEACALGIADNVLMQRSIARAVLKSFFKNITSYEKIRKS